MTSTGFCDADGEELIEGDVVRHVRHPERTGLVIRGDGDPFIDCRDCPGADVYDLSTADEWRVIRSIDGEREVAVSERTRSD